MDMLITGILVGIILGIIIGFGIGLSIERPLSDEKLRKKLNKSEKDNTILSNRLSKKIADQLLSDVDRQYAERISHESKEKIMASAVLLRETRRVLKRFIGSFRYMAIHSDEETIQSALAANEMENLDVFKKSILKIIRDEVNKGVSSRNKKR